MIHLSDLKCSREHTNPWMHFPLVMAELTSCLQPRGECAQCWAPPTKAPSPAVRRTDRVTRGSCVCVTNRNSLRLLLGGQSRPAYIGLQPGRDVLLLGLPASAEEGFLWGPMEKFCCLPSATIRTPAGSWVSKECPQPARDFPPALSVEPRLSLLRSRRRFSLQESHVSLKEWKS